MSLVKCGIDLSSVKFKTADINLQVSQLKRPDKTPDQIAVFS